MLISYFSKKKPVEDVLWGSEYASELYTYKYLIIIYNSLLECPS